MFSDDQPFTPDDKAASTASPHTVPGHELLRQIARGSYSEIWLARTELGAFRAVKIVRRANFTAAKPYDREFAGIQRYEPVSREHEGLVDVLQVFLTVASELTSVKSPGSDKEVKPLRCLPPLCARR